jgi:hypothetical protein
LAPWRSVIFTDSTVQGRWQTASMASCGWVVCWCQLCEQIAPWWGYAMGRHKINRKQTQLHFIGGNLNPTEIPWRDPEAHYLAIHMPQVSAR